MPEVDEVVALPALEGPATSGLPADKLGFIPVDDGCRIRGCAREFAAGDVTDFPVKQGGIAAQMALAAVRSIATRLDMLGDAQPFRPTLDGTLLTGGAVHHFHQSLVAGASEATRSSIEESWLPSTKVTAPFLTDYLGEHHVEKSVSGTLDNEESSTEPSGGRRR